MMIRDDIDRFMEKPDFDRVTEIANTLLILNSQNKLAEEVTSILIKI